MENSVYLSSMKNTNEIQPLVSDFERIKQVADDGRVFWSARDLASALGYSTYQKFERILGKAIAAARATDLAGTDHFNQTVEMVRLGSGSFRKVENYHLSCEACLLIAEKAHGRIVRGGRADSQLPLRRNIPKQGTCRRFSSPKNWDNCRRRELPHGSPDQRRPSSGFLPPSLVLWM